jgi:hypothetical protein
MSIPGDAPIFDLDPPGEDVREPKGVLGTELADILRTLEAVRGRRVVVGDLEIETRSQSALHCLHGNPRDRHDLGLDAHSVSSLT